MPQKAKKKKHKKFLSSSSDEDEKPSKSDHKGAKRKLDTKKEDSHVREQEAEDHTQFSKDGTQSGRKIKNPVYRLQQSPVSKEEENKTESKHSVTHQKGTASNNVKSAVENVFHTGMAGPSKSLSKEGASKKNKEKKSKDSSVKGTSQINPSTTKGELMKPRLVTIKEKVDGQGQLKRKRRWDVPPQTLDDASLKSKEAKKRSPDAKNVLSDKRTELVKQRQQQRNQEEDLKSKIKTKKPSVATTKQSSSTTKTSPTSATNVSKTTEASHAQQQNTQTVCITVLTHPPPVLSNFKIPKKVTTDVQSAKDNNTVPTNSGSKPPNTTSNLKQKTFQQTPCNMTVSSGLNIQNQDPGPSFSGNFSAVCHTDPSPWQDQVQVVEELHLARSEKRLEVNVMQSYGELTCMEIDPPDDGATDTQSKQLPQQDLIIVLDTNILLSHMGYVKKIVSRGLEAVSRPIVLIPWVVLQELDSLKKGRDLSGSVAHLAIPAISYIYNSLKSKENRLWGQSMQQAAASTNGLNAENNDDRVLQCCLQYQSLYPGCTVILCTNDKNLCNKALLSGVKALSKNDLETKVARSSKGDPFLQNIQTLIPPHTRRSVPTPLPSRSCAAAETRSGETTGLSVEKDNKQQTKADDAKRRSWCLSSLVCEFENCLQEALSDVLKAEMKAAYEDLWLEIVYVKPPWSLSDVLQCFKKHWIAVFGQLVPRTKLQNVLSLIRFFNSGKTLDCSSSSAALQEAKDLLREFVKSSSRVTGAISVVDNILYKLQSQGDSTAFDVVMKEDDEDKQCTSAQVSQREVWALFENIWTNVFQISMEVFKAVGFDPNATPSVQPVGGPAPPQEALACLEKLFSLVSQLLQAFSSVLSPAPGLADVQTLLGVIQSSNIVNVDKLTATDLLDLFSQQEYRERLRVGGNQLMQLKEALDRCVNFTGQHVPFTAQT